MKFTIQQLISVAKREIKLREAVYYKKIYSGKMKEQEANYQIGAMLKILSILEGLKNIPHCSKCGEKIKPEMIVNNQPGD
jgi:hypothetical protein